MTVGKDVHSKSSNRSNDGCARVGTVRPLPLALAFGVLLFSPLLQAQSSARPQPSTNQPTTSQSSRDPSFLNVEDEYRPLEFQERKADATDRTPPVIIHEPLRTLARGTVEFRIRIEDESAVALATFYWRRAGTRSYTPLALDGEEGMYVARIEAKNDFEYWIEAFDEHGNGPALHGSGQSPHKAFVYDPEPEDEKDDSGRPTPGSRRTRLSGPLGISRIQSVRTAIPLQAGRGELRASGDVFAGSNFVVPASSLVAGTADLRLALGLADWLELNLSTNGRYAHMSPKGGTPGQLFSSAGNLALGARWVSPDVHGFRFAGELNVALPNPIGATGWAASPQLLAATTWSHPWVRVHGHLGYLWDNSAALLEGRWASLVPLGIGLSRYDWLSAGAAVEVPIGPFSGFVTYTLDVPFDRAHFARCNGTGCVPNPPLVPARGWQLPHRAGLGGRWQATNTLAVDLGAEFSLTRHGQGLDQEGPNASLEGYAPSVPWALNARLVWQFKASPISEWFASILPQGWAGDDRMEAEDAGDGPDADRSAANPSDDAPRDDAPREAARSDASLGDTADATESADDAEAHKDEARSPDSGSGSTILDPFSSSSTSKSVTSTEESRPIPATAPVDAAPLNPTAASSGAPAGVGESSDSEDRADGSTTPSGDAAPTVTGTELE